MVMEIGETIYVHRRADWRRWLRAHFQTKAEIWLVLPHKNSDKASIVYNDAVEEALCFGWIDSIKKKLAVDAAVRSGRPGSLLTLAPHRSGRAGSAASGSSTDGFATRRRVPVLAPFAVDRSAAPLQSWGTRGVSPAGTLEP